MTLFTIGFTKKNAKQFFELLIAHGVKTIIDTRANNNSQLAGFTKGGDLPYLASAVAGIGYRHIKDFAPTKELLKAYREKEISWDEYAQRYRELLDARDIRSRYDIAGLEHGCLLCSEELPAHCHRRLLAEYFLELNPGLRIIHI